MHTLRPVGGGPAHQGAVPHVRFTHKRQHRQTAIGEAVHQGDDLVPGHLHHREQVDGLRVLGYLCQGAVHRTVGHHHLEVAAGVRWFDYQRDRLTPTATGLFGFPVRIDNIKDDGFSPTFTASFFASEDATIYARVAIALRPGFGFTTIFPP